jgi:hypothetical protein
MRFNPTFRRKIVFSHFSLVVATAVNIFRLPDGKESNISILHECTLISPECHVLLAVDKRRGKFQIFNDL